MLEKEIKIRYDEICGYLSDRKLKPAFNSLSKLISANGLGELFDECRSLEETYNYMLKYTLEGIKDPERQKVYRRLIVSAFELADKVYETLRLKHSVSTEYQRKRSFMKVPAPVLNRLAEEIENLKAESELQEIVTSTLSSENKTFGLAIARQEKVLSVFNQTWFADQLDENDRETTRKLIEGEVIEVPYKSLIISGITLSLLRYFDDSKFSLLFGLYSSDEDEIRQRALVGLLICFYKYSRRMNFYPEITGRLKILNEDARFKRNLEWLIRQFIRTRETERIQQKIRDEIIPEMIKISPNLKNKINLENLMDLGLGDDKNPEWEELFKDSPGFMDKMEEFSEMQMEGSDVFLSSFAMLKSFPFFNELPNWFMPFFEENPAIHSEIDFNDQVSMQFLHVIGSAPILCNSDKYSFCFSIQNLPEDNRDLIAQGMQAEMDQFNELEKDEEFTNPGKRAEYISNQYLQDLYRFYKLYPHSNDFDDVFAWRLDFYNIEGLNEILREDKPLLKNMAEYYFAKNQFDDAAEIYELLLGEEKSGELYQKAAYCYQKQGHFKKALKAYLKADLYEQNKLWNLKKIAFCYRNLKETDKALEYYRQAELLDPENLNIQLSIGHCLLELKSFEEALKSYFKVEYLSPGNRNVWRPIAWCSFVTGKKEQAKKYYLQLTENEPTKYDLMNFGHVEWSLGNRREALGLYKRSVKEAQFAEQEFFNVFEEDLSYLVEQGVDKDDVPIMLDLLRYSLEK
jgi:tetratricopeptide (TPR) repeat protein